MRASLPRTSLRYPPQLPLLLALVLFDVFLVCAAEHVGIGRPVADNSRSACLTVPDDGTDRLLDTLRQPEWLAAESTATDAEPAGLNTLAAARPPKPQPWTFADSHPVSRLPLHLRHCVWLV